MKLNLIPRVVCNKVITPDAKIIVDATAPLAGSELSIHIFGVRRYGIETVDSTIIK